MNRTVCVKECSVMQQQQQQQKRKKKYKEEQQLKPEICCGSTWPSLHRKYDGPRVGYSFNRGMCSLEAPVCLRGAHILIMRGTVSATADSDSWSINRDSRMTDNKPATIWIIVHLNNCSFDKLFRNNDNELNLTCFPTIINKYDNLVTVWFLFSFSFFLQTD